MFARVIPSDDEHSAGCSRRVGSGAGCAGLWRPGSMPHGWSLRTVSGCRASSRLYAAEVGIQVFEAREIGESGPWRFIAGVRACRPWGSSLVGPICFPRRLSGAVLNRSAAGSLRGLNTRSASTAGPAPTRPTASRRCGWPWRQSGRRIARRPSAARSSTGYSAPSIPNSILGSYSITSDGDTTLCAVQRYPGLEGTLVPGEAVCPRGLDIGPAPRSGTSARRGRGPGRPSWPEARRASRAAARGRSGAEPASRVDDLEPSLDLFVADAAPEADRDHVVEGPVADVGGDLLLRANVNAPAAGPSEGSSSSPGSRRPRAAGTQRERGTPASLAEPADHGVLPAMPRSRRNSSTRLSPGHRRDEGLHVGTADLLDHVPVSAARRDSGHRRARGQPHQAAVRVERLHQRVQVGLARPRPCSSTSAPSGRPRARGPGREARPPG